MPQRSHPRIVAVVPGDPMDYHTQSGVARRFVDALDEQVPVVGRIDASMTRSQRAIAAAMNFHPRRDDWRRNMHTSAIGARFRAENLRRGLLGTDREFDLVFHVRSSYMSTDFPFVTYLDNTSHIGLEYWPALARSSRNRIELGRLREQRAWSRAAHLFVTGGLVKSSLMNQYDIPESRITVVGGGVNFEPLPLVVDATRPPSVLFVGFDFARKGGYELLEAFRFVQQHVPSATLRVVGANPAISAPGVEVLGRIRERAVLSRIYCEARVFCLPAQYEPYGMVILEAMAHGLPVLTTDVGATSEILDGGKAGVLVPANDPVTLRRALLELLADDGTKAAEIGRKARARIERDLTWPRVIDRIVSVLEQLPGRPA